MLYGIAYRLSSHQKMTLPMKSVFAALTLTYLKELNALGHDDNTSYIKDGFYDFSIRFI